MTDSPPATAPLDVEMVLVPVDGSDESVTAVEYAVAIAEKYDAKVHAVYVVGQDVVRGIEEGVLDQAEVADDAQTFIEQVEDSVGGTEVPLNSSTAYGFSTHRKTQHPGSVILDTADDLEADFIVVPREPLTSDSGDVLAKAAEYVLLYASQPLLSV
ncbi:universal stress protein [Haloarchaeobius sp. HME9146]|uniref:universal stress protein n=1 Tax=Haloarchaeobius sp. HME9146 TaxID=2978732 RepID=UPI0021C0AF77|nr:universal stress protein [Haloarchaeobius sp. HME9146]MCT9095218.1 universal stress protein [Haloarchaeobius sp. HME9146]